MLMALSSVLELVGFALISVPILSFLKAHLFISSLSKPVSEEMEKLNQIITSTEMRDAVFPGRREMQMLIAGVVLSITGLLIKSYYYIDKLVS